MENKTKQVLVFRTDLKEMTTGKAIAQGSHSVLKVFFDRIDREASKDGKLVMTGIRDYEYHWIFGIFRKISLGCKSEAELLDLLSKAQAADLPCALITDAGLTCFDGKPTNTCISIGPAPEDQVDLITGHLKMYKN